MKSLAKRVNTCLSNLYKIINDGMVKLLATDYSTRIEFSSQAAFNTRKNYHFVKSLNEAEMKELNNIINDLKKHKLKKTDEKENNTDVLILDDKLVSFYNYESGYRKALLDYINIYIDSDNAEK